MENTLGTKAKQIITTCEKVLKRKLTSGEKADLLLDNLSWLNDSQAAHELLKQIGEEN